MPEPVKELVREPHQMDYKESKKKRLYLVGLGLLSNFSREVEDIFEKVR